MYVYPNISPLPTVVAAQSLGSAAVVNQFLCQRPVSLVFIGFAISTQTVSSGNIVVTIKKRNGIGVSAGEVSLGTITIPTGALVGKVYGKYIDPSVFGIGDVIAFEVTTAAAGMGAAGAGFSMIQVNYSPEELSNNPDFIQSA
jgi:hypothetical protein